MDISELAEEFEFVDSVTVERNKVGKIDLKMPQQRYNKSDETSIHQYGWGPFCKFHVDTSKYRETAGVYIFTANHQIMYVGEAGDIHNRIQAGYSNISPRNCFEGGQQTNCRINNAIFEVIRDRGQVALWAKEAVDRKQCEAELIGVCDPRWNLVTPSSGTVNQQQISGADNTPSKQKHTVTESPPSKQPIKAGKYKPLQL